MVPSQIHFCYATTATPRNIFSGSQFSIFNFTFVISLLPTFFFLINYLYTVPQQPSCLHRELFANNKNKPEEEDKAPQNTAMDGHGQPDKPSGQLDQPKRRKHLRCSIYTFNVDKAFSDRGKKNPREQQYLPNPASQIFH